jgi:phage shock protein C
MGDVQPPQPPPQPPARKLYRSETNRMIAGVCGGLAEYYNIDVTLVRVIFLALAVLGGGLGIVLYGVMWLMVPDESKALPPTGR